MNLQQIRELLNTRLSKHLGITISSVELNTVGGGSINDTYRVVVNNSIKFFFKLNSILSFPGLFEKEKNGLAFLAAQKIILIPHVVLCETNETDQWLLLEWVEGGIRTGDFWKKFGEQLAQLHRTTHDQFGFAEDNYMGSLPQANTFTTDWPHFFIRYRLQPQIELARNKQLLDKSHIHLFDALFKQVDGLFAPEKPALLHGDLWSGNFICNDQSLPVLIDPAIYFGHRSMDLAMTTLFGGFDQTFYDAYHYHFPLPANYREQWEVCNLYPLLIHLNLFGQSYLAGITATLKRF
jgi:protein-ribulosamine 3-kinase